LQRKPSAAFLAHPVYDHMITFIHRAQ